jgi:hypothetical protein
MAEVVPLIAQQPTEDRPERGPVAAGGENRWLA